MIFYIKCCLDLGPLREVLNNNDKWKAILLKIVKSSSKNNAQFIILRDCINNIFSSKFKLIKFSYKIGIIIPTNVSRIGIVYFDGINRVHLANPNDDVNVDIKSRKSIYNYLVNLIGSSVPNLFANNMKSNLI